MIDGKTIISKTSDRVHWEDVPTSGSTINFDLLQAHYFTFSFQNFIDVFTAYSCEGYA